MFCFLFGNIVRSFVRSFVRSLACSLTRLFHVVPSFLFRSLFLRRHRCRRLILFLFQISHINVNIDLLNDSFNRK